MSAREKWKVGREIIETKTKKSGREALILHMTKKKKRGKNAFHAHFFFHAQKQKKQVEHAFLRNLLGVICN